MAPRPQNCNPATWDEYDGRASPSRSLSTGNLAEEDVIDDNDEQDGDYDEESGRLIAHADRRRSSVSQRLTAMADIGGVNSFRSFARSWQRAAQFPEVISRRPSIVFNDEAAAEHDEGGTREEEDEAIYYGRSPVAATPTIRSGLLAQHLEETAAASAEAATGQHAPEATQEDFRAREGKLLDAEMAAGALPAAGGSASSRSSLFAAPHLSSPSVIGSYGSYRSSSQYGTLPSGTVRRHPRRASIRRSSAAAAAHDGPAFGEDSPILVVREVKHGDRVVLTVDGQSTLPQSTFNAVNAIIGVGMLSLPLALRHSGWLLGLAVLTATAAVTAHTARLLARCMHRDPALVTYSDLAYVAFGARARVVVAGLFTLELLAACVALVILFADSLDLLLPGRGPTAWKCVCAALVLVLNTLPLRWLSYTSVVGIFSTFCIVCIVVIDGLVKKETPGSLWEPAVTHLWPSNWLALPLAYGLMASPWGAHSVFPSIYRDMRHPHKWDKAVTITFSFSYVLDTCLAVVGILMFGDGIREAITSNILRTDGFPPGLTFFMCVCVGIIPLTKIPLSARPLVTTADVILGLHFESPQQQAGSRRWVGNVQRASVRIGVVLVLLAISIVFPAFDSVCAFLGAALCTLISIVLPIAFYLKLFRDEISHKERIVSWVIIIVFSILGSIGTACTFFPKSMVDAQRGAL